MKRIVVSIMIGAVGVCLALGGYMLGLHNGEVWTTAYYEEVAETEYEEKVNERLTKKEEKENSEETTEVADSSLNIEWIDDYTVKCYEDGVTYLYEYRIEDEIWEGWIVNNYDEKIHLDWFSQELPENITC